MTRQKRTDAGRTLRLGWDDAAPGPEPPRAAAADGAARADGAAAPRTEGPAPGSHQTADGVPEDGSSRRRRVLGAAGVLALVLALVLVLPRVLLGGGPEAPVREYLDALVAVDVATVREHLAIPPGVSDAAVDEEVLEASADRIDAYSIHGIRSEGRHATVTATLRAAASEQQVDFTLTAGEGGSFTRAHWELDPVPVAAYALTLPGHAEELHLNGVTLPLSDLAVRASEYGQQNVVLSLLPGTYRIGLPTPGALLAPVDEQLEVLPGTEDERRGGLILGLELSAAGEELVIEQIQERLRECTRSTVAAPEDCPFSALNALEQRTVAEDAEGSWEVSAPTEFAIERWAGETWTVSSGHGEAVFTPAPDADGSAGTPLHVIFFADAVTTLTAPDQLESQLLGASSVQVTCLDAEDGTVEGGALVEDGGIADVCEGIGD